MNLFQSASIALAFSLSMPALAQTVSTPIYSLLRPLVEIDASGNDMCGVVATTAVIINNKVETYNFQFYVAASSLMGHVSAGALTTPPENTKQAAAQKKLPRPTGFWIKKKDDGEALRMRDIEASSKPGQLYGTADLVPATRQLWNLINGEETQLSIEYPNQRSQTIIEFSEKLPDEDYDAMLACMKNLTVSVHRVHEANKAR